jgi:hypothetical protein
MRASASSQIGRTESVCRSAIFIGSNRRSERSTGKAAKVRPADRPRSTSSKAASRGSSVRPSPRTVCSSASSASSVYKSPSSAACTDCGTKLQLIETRVGASAFAAGSKDGPSHTGCSLSICLAAQKPFDACFYSLQRRCGEDLALVAVGDACFGLKRAFEQDMRV